MIFLDKEHVVSALSTFAYHRAARQINQLYDKQIRVKRYLDYDDSYYGADEILNEIEHLLYAISFEELDEEQREIYEEAVSGDDTYIHRYMSVPFYFGPYVKHRDLFSIEEQKDWEQKMLWVVNGFPTGFVIPGYEYLELYTREEDYSKLQRECTFWKNEHIFIFEINYELHTLEDFGIRFWNALRNFAKKYHAFYQELIQCIQEKRRCNNVSLLN